MTFDDLTIGGKYEFTVMRGMTLIARCLDVGPETAAMRITSAPIIDHSIWLRSDNLDHWSPVTK